jgi:hypothetical protein
VTVYTLLLSLKWKSMIRIKFRRDLSLLFLFCRFDDCVLPEIYYFPVDKLPILDYIVMEGRN